MRLYKEQKTGNYHSIYLNTFFVFPECRQPRLE